MVLTTSPCVRAMHGRYLVHRGKCDGAEVAAWEDATLAAYRQTQRQPAILRRVRALELFAQTAIIAAQGDDLLLGSQRFLELGGPRRPEVRQELGRLDWSMDIGHIIHDYRGLLSEGIGGRIGRIRQRQDAAAGDAKLTLECFARAVRAFEVFIRRHADHAARLAASSSSPLSPDWLGLASDLEAIASAPAASLRQAIQLVWLAQIFLHAENPASAISFGRLDQILWPFASADLAAGRIDHDGLAELVAAFCLRCCEGEESQNLALGGVDSEGRDATNPLSLLFTEVVGELRLPQPSLSIRWHADADPRLLAAGCALAATGLGQPAFLNDQAVIPAMQAVGIPVDRARDYGIVGCYEASPQGDCYANTVGCGFSLTGILVRYIASASAVDSASLREGFLQAVAAEYQALLKQAPRPEVQHHVLALAHSLAGRPGEAEKHYARLSARDPSLPHVWLLRARMLALDGRVLAAADQCRKALARGASPPAILTARGVFNTILGNYDQARKELAVGPDPYAAGTFAINVYFALARHENYATATARILAADPLSRRSQDLVIIACSAGPSAGTLAGSIDAMVGEQPGVLGVLNKAVVMHQREAATFSRLKLINVDSMWARLVGVYKHRPLDWRWHLGMEGRDEHEL